MRWVKDTNPTYSIVDMTEDEADDLCNYLNRSQLVSSPTNVTTSDRWLETARVVADHIERALDSN